MLGRENGKTVASLYERFNQRDMEGLKDLVSDSLEWLDVPRGITFWGKEGFRKFHEGWLRAFPDTQVEIKSLVEAGEWVVVEFIAHGRHTGPLEGLPPTGRPIDLRFCQVHRLQDGKVIGGRSYYDVATLLAQLGAIQEPLAA